MIYNIMSCGNTFHIKRPGNIPLFRVNLWNFKSFAGMLPVIDRNIRVISKSNIIAPLLISRDIGGFILYLFRRFIIRPFVMRKINKNNVEESKLPMMKEAWEVLRNAR